MKKIVISLSLALAIIFGGSCKKDQDSAVEPTSASQTSTVDVKEGRLVFDQAYYQSLSDSPEDVEKAIETVKELDFNSVGENGPSAHCKLKSAKLDEVPAFLQEIINADGIVQIGQYIVKLNFATEKVLVLPLEHEHELADLLAENVSNKNIRVFGMEEEVLSALENETSKVSLCFKKGAPSNSKSGSISCIGYNNTAVALKYEKFGVWFELNVDIRTGSNSDKRTFKTDYYASWSYNCKGSGSARSSYTETNDKVVVKPYKGTNALGSYYLEAAVYCVQANCNYYYGKLSY